MQLPALPAVKTPMPHQQHNTPTLHMAPWEKAFDRVLTPLEHFIHKQTTSSILLMSCAIAALCIANSPAGDAFIHATHLPLALSFGARHFELSLAHWINEALMALFFLLVGLELKRELLVGELADIRRAALPIVAALGGMLVPALFYWYWNPTGQTSAGWGIPMATDIAFAVGALSLLGNRVPKSLVTFLIALAIVDDLGAVLVIALFYTQQLNISALLVVLLLIAVLLTFNFGGIRRLLPYLLVGLLLWCAMLSSGIHATLTGVILAFTIPIRPKYNPEHFIQEVSELSQNMQHSLHANPDILHNDTLRSQIIALERGVELVQAPAQRLEDRLHLIVAYLVIPLFALANAAITVEANDFVTTLLNPVTLGVTSGLILGKWLGIAGSTWLAIRTGIATLPADMTMRHVHGIALLGGIGFTMSIFVADLAFDTDPNLLLMAKTGILLASAVAGVSGYCWLRFGCKSNSCNAMS